MNVTAQVAGFAAVDLETLTRAAALQTRVDRKYILPARDLPEVLARLSVDTRVLDIAGERALRYRSCYFDTPDLDSYLGAVHGRRRRFKVRARTYVDSGDTFLEIKTRGGRSATVKDRIPVTDRGLSRSGVGHAAALLQDAGIPRAPSIATALIPVLETQYRRVTLLLPDGRDDASRATIDLDLVWHDIDGASLALADTVIVETKSAQRPGSMDRALWRAGHRPATLSKYGTGLAALRPTLPHNKWHRVLGRHFDHAPELTPTALRLSGPALPSHEKDPDT